MRKSALKRKRTSPTEISVQFDVRGASIRKTGIATILQLTDDSIDTDKLYTILQATVASNILSKYQILYYNCSLHGWETLQPNAMLSTDVLKYNNETPILDLLLEDVRQLPDLDLIEDVHNNTTPALLTPNFAIGMWHSKTAYNLISLQRSATQLGAQFVFSISDRMKNKEPLKQRVQGETIPIHEYKTLLDFSMDTISNEYEWVCIEMGGIPLNKFVHPKKAIYILGSEDSGISSMLRSACKHVIELSSVRSASFNVAVAGTMVMYDRHVKECKGNSLAEE
mgnify:CR=1 FL=1|tara:strand:- start:225 stop:1070 length:846 start_codon:yes stop_codon:yes gene_type:complete